MRTPVLAAVGLLLAGASAARADAAADAKALVARAVKATGAKDDGKPVTLSWKDVGTVHVGGARFEYTADWWFRAPDALRFDMAGDFMGMKVKLTEVISGDKVWDAADGKVQEVAGDKRDYATGMAYQMWVATLAPLAHDKGFALSTVVGKKVNDKPAAGVLVERKGRPVITLYFDKETGLLVKSEMLVKDEFQGWKEVLDEAFYEDWKEADGQKVFTKVRVVRDGKLLIESAMSDMKVLEKLDPKLFEKP